MWVLLISLMAGDANAVEPSLNDIQFFEKSIRPILVEHCLKCHGPEKQWANLRLDTREGLLQGGENGAVFDADHPGQSRLLEAIRQTDPDLKMPPEGKLSEREILDFVRWVEQGALYPLAAQAGKKRERSPDHWAFQPPSNPAVPEIQHTHWPLSPIDAFVFSRMEAHHLQPAEPATKSNLLRRMTFDLIGLPPSLEEMNEFLNEPRPDASSRLVDRLLASAHYGEKWGRHWLDVARYADSNGLDENVCYGNAWRYRDYVVDSLNRDKPYHQFLAEQLAGDLLPEHDEIHRRELLVATGFLGIGPKVLAEVDQTKMRMDIVDEQIETVGKALLGMTLGCARCHDHKFDPIDTADYYGLAGIFKSTKTMESYTKVAKWHEAVLPSAESRAQQADYERLLQEKEREVAQSLAMAKTLLQSTMPDQPLPENFENQFPAETQQKLKELRDQRDAMQKSPPDLPSAMSVTEDQVADVAIHLRGNPLKLGAIVPRHVPAVMRGPGVPEFTPQTSGRHEFVEWLIDPAHPLTSRVIVNRIWRWHFSKGIVPSTDNFGLLGEKPSHPDLLDWLARRFVSDGWSFKQFHRLLLNSATYQQQSLTTQQHLDRDPENQWLSHANLRRLHAEEVRDSLLASCQKLDTRLGGSLLTVKNRAYFFDHTSIDHTDYSSTRRSLYLPIVRNHVYDVFQLLDFPDPAVPTGDRVSTTVAPQALMMLNSDFVMDCAQALATQLSVEEPDDLRRLQRLFHIAYGRPPTPAEIDEHWQLLRELNTILSTAEKNSSPSTLKPWDVLCQTILLANEFLYVQ